MSLPDSSVLIDYINYLITFNEKDTKKMIDYSTDNDFIKQGTTYAKNIISIISMCHMSINVCFKNYKNYDVKIYNSNLKELLKNVNSLLTKLEKNKYLIYFELRMELICYLKDNIKIITLILVLLS